MRAGSLVLWPGARRFVPRRFSMILFMGTISSEVATISCVVVEVFFLRRPFELFLFLCCKLFVRYIICKLYCIF